MLIFLGMWLFGVIEWLRISFFKLNLNLPIMGAELVEDLNVEGYILVGVFYFGMLKCYNEFR